MAQVDRACITVLVAVCHHLIAYPFGCLSDSEVAQKLVVDFYEAGKPTAAVCHGPIVFKNIKLSDGSVLVAGKKVIGFTNAEETAVGKTEVVAEPSGPGSCEDALTAAGATFKDAGVFTIRFCAQMSESLISGTRRCFKPTYALRAHSLLGRIRHRPNQLLRLSCKH